MNYKSWNNIYVYVSIYQDRLSWIDEEDIKAIMWDYLGFLLYSILNSRHSLMCAYFAMLEAHGIEAPEHETFIF